MDVILKIEQWSNTHHPKWLVALRIGLGLCLFVKGCQFIQNQALFSQMLTQSGIELNNTWLPIIIPWAQLFGGLFISFGLLTRLVALSQIPVLIGAVFFVNMKQGTFINVSELLFSAIILILLVVFLIEGGGPFSMDRVLKDSEN